MPSNVSLASLATAFAVSSVYWTDLIASEPFQVLALTVASIIGVAVVAIVLICIPDYLNGRHKKRRRTRDRGRTWDRHNNSSRSSKSSSEKHRPSSRSKDRRDQNEDQSVTYSLNSVKSNSTSATSKSSRQKTPSMPPLGSRKYLNNSTKNTSNISNSNERNGRIIDKVPMLTMTSQRPRATRRHSLPPRLSSRASLSKQCLDPIVERKLENLMDYDDYWWKELDSRTQYCALILGYTQFTWDEDLSLEDLPCEDWYWEEMTTEQQAAAQHFGYSRETWEDE